MIFDVFSRLSNASQSNVKNKIKIFDVFYDHYVDLLNNELRFVTFQNISVITYHVTLMKMSNNFKQRLKIIYINDSHWIKILIVIFSFVQNQIEHNNIDQINNKLSTINESSTSNNSLKKKFLITNDLSTNSNLSFSSINKSTDSELSTSSNSSFSLINLSTNNKSSLNNELFSSRKIKFRLRDDLIYYVFEKEKNRWCISKIMKHKIFQMIHDFNNHENFHRTYD